MPEPNPVMGLAISGVSPSAIAVSASVTWSCASSGKRPNSLSAPLIHEMLRKAFRCLGANVVIFHNTVKLLCACLDDGDDIPTSEHVNVWTWFSVNDRTEKRRGRKE